LILDDHDFLIFHYLIKTVLLDGITISCMVRLLVQNQALGKEEAATPELKLRTPPHNIAGPTSRMLSSTSDFRAPPTFKSSAT
jgi:hypothetical protein